MWWLIRWNIHIVAHWLVDLVATLEVMVAQWLRDMCGGSLLGGVLADWVGDVVAHWVE